MARKRNTQGFVSKKGKAFGCTMNYSNGDRCPNLPRIAYCKSCDDQLWSEHYESNKEYRRLVKEIERYRKQLRAAREKLQLIIDHWMF